MKIIQVIPYFCFGGAEAMCENLTYALKKLGHTVKVVCLYNEHTPISDRMEAAGISITYLDKKLGLDISMIPKLQTIFREEKPDVVHTHLDVIKYAVPAAKLAGVKQCVHTVHSVAHKEAEGLLQKIVNHLFYHWAWSIPVALSTEVQQTVREFYHLPVEKIPVVMNGIDLSRCIPKTDYRLSEPIRLLHVGRFDTPKNHKGLLRSFAELRTFCPQVHLTMVGDGQLRESIEALAEELGLRGGVTFAGMQENVYPFLHEADIFLLPSSYEGMPMTIIEAMGTGLPIVATAVGGVPDMIRNEESGLLVPCDSEAVAEACYRVIRDEDFRKNLGQAALKDSSRFSSLEMADNYLKIYQN